MYTNSVLYLLTFLSSLILGVILTPAARSAAIVLDIIDVPLSSVKTHKEPVPYLGGVAIFLAFVMSLLWVRVLTSFPTGTLRSLRGILSGGCFILVVGLIDDVKYRGLHYRTKFLFQIAAAVMLMLFGIRIKFIQPPWIAGALTIVWVVGVTNAFNLIDIMDGLAASVAIVSSLAFLLISLPTEEIYVNFAAAALCGACLGFLPFNLSRQRKIFMGDAGSLFLGFIASALSLGTSYSGKTEVGVFAPLLILGIPLFDTILVFSLRIKRGLSPFLGSKDHFPLRMESLGWTRHAIVGFVVFLCLILCGLAYLLTTVNLIQALVIFSVAGVLFASLTIYIIRVKVK